MKKEQMLSILVVLGLILTACPQPGGGGGDGPGLPTTSYTVTFNVNNGAPAPAPQSVVSGGKANAPTPPTRANYEFGGWYKETTLSTLWNFATDTVSGNITLHAKWTAATTFTVSFDVNGGTPELEPQYIPSGGRAYDPGTVTNTGNTFGGWYREPGFVTRWDFATDTVIADITLYAEWTAAGSNPDIGAIGDWLDSQTGGESTADPLELVVSLDLGNMPIDGSNWKQLLAVIDARGKYVNLDLSGCTLTGTEFDPDHWYSVGKRYITGIILPNAATSIVNGSSLAQAFGDFTNLESAEGANIGAIGEYDFYECTSLSSVDFPEAVNIGDYAFYGADLSSVDFPEAVNIGEYALGFCSSLSSVSFPVAESIGKRAFSGSNLSSVDFPVAASIGESAFESCTSLSSVNIPAVTSIDFNAFRNTGAALLTITMGGTAPTLHTLVFGRTTFTSRNVLVKVPGGATGYGTIPGTYSSTNSTGNWGNGFRGGGWNGSSMTETGNIDAYITLNIQSL